MNRSSVANLIIRREIQPVTLLLTSPRIYNVGFDINYLKSNLTAFCSDGASVMLGRKSGVSSRLLKDFPGTIIWHCLSHRLQLVLDHSIHAIKQINHFKIFIDKIYVIFHKSNKNQLELKNISEELGLDIIKIGRVLGSSWAACGLRVTVAVWLIQHYINIL